jgi:hypothetical protein
MACGTVKAEIQYLKRLSLYTKEKPFQLFVPVDRDATDTRTTNLEFESREQVFEDIRGKAATCTLDNDGFRVVEYPTALNPEQFRDRETVESDYFDDVKDILRDIENGYDEVFIFDWRVGYIHHKVPS